MYRNEEHLKTTRRFLDFVHILQEADIPVSPAETIDMFSALQYIDFSDRITFKQALATSLIKDYTDLPVFEKCFLDFFERKGGAALSLNDQAIELSGISEMMESLSLSRDDLDMISNELEGILEHIPDEDLAGKSPDEILSMILDEQITSSSSGGIGISLLKGKSRHGNGRDGTDTDKNAEVLAILFPLIRRRLNEKNIGKAIHRREQYLLQRYIYQLKPSEIQEMRELVKRFGQKLKNRISLRKKKVKHGGLDVKRTFRFNLKFEGTPFKLFYRNRKIDRPQLVVLCDISGSVNQYSRFMLLLTYTLQSLFSKVRTFAFISNIVEITPLFIEMDPERALNSIFNDTDFTYGFGSNYGRCFKQFVREYGDSLNHKTTVLILGDARNNNQEPGIDAFIEIKERSRNVFWMNPDKKHLWNWSDSIAGLYLPYCNEMREVNNFMDLSDFIDKLFVRQYDLGNYKTGLHKS